MEMYFSNMTAQEGTKEKLVQDLMTLVHDAEELVKTAGGDVAARSKTELLAALERMKASCRKVETRAVAGAKRTDQLIRQNPYQSIGLAFGLGLLLGVLVSRD